MKKITLTLVCFAVLLTTNLWAQETRENILFWDYNTLSGTPSIVYPDFALDQTYETEIWPVNDRGEGDMTFRALRTAATAGIDGTPCLRSSNWEEMPIGIKYWLFDRINVDGFNDIIFSSYIYSTSSPTNKGPQAFRLDYRLEEEGEWVAVGDFVIIDKTTMQNLFSWNLPAACNGCKTLAIRLVSNNKSIDDGIGAVGVSAFNGLDNTTISGVKANTSIEKNEADIAQLFVVRGNSIEFTDSSLCQISDLAGRILFKETVSKGQNITVASGIYIVNVTDNNVSISHKLIVK